MAKSKQARPRCWFCGAEGVTDEHVLGRQFAKIWPAAGPWYHATRDPDRPGTPKVVEAGGPRFIVRIPCGDCNGGWMGSLDDAAVGLVSSMARGRVVVLDLDARETLAAWAAKVILCMSAKEPASRRFVSRAHYLEMGRTHRPPAGMTLWLGSVDRSDPLLFRPNDVTLRDGTTGYGATLSIGRLLFHSIARNAGPAPNLRLLGPAERSFDRISPDTGRAITWPPREVLAPADQWYVAEGVANLSTLTG